MQIRNKHRVLHPAHILKILLRQIVIGLQFYRSGRIMVSTHACVSPLGCLGFNGLGTFLDLQKETCS